jgi:hypothetical protein
MNLKNTTMNSEEIKLLLEKYYEGISTQEEEHLLKKFFSRNDVPGELNAEKVLFRFYSQSSQIPEPSGNFEDRIISAIDDADEKIVRIKSRRLYITLSGIAAGLLILAGSYFFFTDRSELRDTYSDPELAYAETMKILYNVSVRLNNGTRSLRQISLLQDETRKSLIRINRSTTVIRKEMKPLNNLIKVIGKSESNLK